MVNKKMADIDEIRSIATQVRHVMDNLIANNKISHNWIPFGKFPKGCCGDMSIILATHLKSVGFELADYICGRHHEDGRSHAWLRLDGVCIDITADQFDFASFPKVIVEYEDNYPLKKIFETNGRSSKYEVDNLSLGDMYKQIKEQLASQ